MCFVIIKIIGTTGFTQTQVWVPLETQHWVRGRTQHWVPQGNPDLGFARAQCWVHKEPGSGFLMKPSTGLTRNPELGFA
ncbi:hypothetical protein SLEP1_g26012 [Rubroshorea leprosula]|uniref:Uncharacterized protein n=1 Tax=Rubroshorea leprosula TaxID=152421 RepID=A0AAV5JWY6_9ROSI|nr:hypothetical protein SLEP1_g26012 [Rubroshorea leprosula]